MSNSIKKILSNDSGPFWQFVKYGVIGVLSTLVQTGVFYVLASTFLQCLKADDIAVRLLNLPSVEIADTLRAFRFSVATGVGFVIANIFCWLMNRWFVFKPGKFRWYTELLMFFSSSTMAMVLALVLSASLIKYCSLMTSMAVAVEVIVAFIVNFTIRKFFIFKG
jgi:putative flippase GtrA